MKKFAMMIAAFSLCTCTFTSCGGDDKDDNKGTAKGAIGAECKSADDCASGYCSEAKQCAEKPAAGESKKADGDACTKAEECQSGECNDNTCGKKADDGGDKKADGEACTKAEECQSGECNDNTCGKKAAEGGDKKADGEACTKAEECQSGECNDNTCGKKADEGGGDKKADGEACTKAEECQSGECNDNTCGKKADEGGGDKKADGEACTKAEECQSGECNDNTCGKKADEGGDKKADGEACTKAEECQSGECNNKKCGKKADGGDKKADGESCTKAEECQSGACNNKKCGKKTDGGDTSNLTEAEKKYYDAVLACAEASNEVTEEMISEFKEDFVSVQDHYPLCLDDYNEYFTCLVKADCSILLELAFDLHELPDGVDLGNCKAYPSKIEACFDEKYLKEYNEFVNKFESCVEDYNKTAEEGKKLSEEVMDDYEHEWVGGIFIPECIDTNKKFLTCAASLECKVLIDDALDAEKVDVGKCATLAEEYAACIIPFIEEIKD